MIYYQTLCLLLCVVGGELCVVDRRKNLTSESKPAIQEPTEPEFDALHSHLEQILSKLKRASDLSSLDESGKQLICRLEDNVNAWIPKRVVNKLNVEGLQEAQFIDYCVKGVKNYSIDPSTKLTKIVVELDINDPKPFCLIVWKYVHAKYISKFVTIEEADELMRNDFKVTEPLWVTLPDPYKIIYDFAREQNPDADQAIFEKIIPLKIQQEEHSCDIMYVWKSNEYDPEFGHMRYIVMAKYEGEEDNHSHYFFISSLANRNEEFRVNYVGGMMSTQQLAEFSVLNFMTLSVQFTHGSWVDYKSKDVTWNPLEYSLADIVKDPTAREAVQKDFLDVLHKEQRKVIAGYPFASLAEPTKVIYFIGLSNADLACPADDAEMLQYVSNSVNYVFLKAQFESEEGGVHTAVMLITSINDVYITHRGPEYEVYVKPSDLKAKQLEVKYCFTNW